MRSGAPILIGHDGSDEAARACSWAASLAAGLDRRLMVANVYSPGDFPGGPDTAAAGSRDNLEAWIAVADTDDLPADRIERAVASGRAGPMLVQLAEAGGAGLVVLGAHSRPLAGSALGRVAQHVTFRSPCPVAVVRAAGGPVTKAPIVVGFDPAHVNPAPVAWARELAGELGVTLEAVTVVPDPEAGPPVGELLEGLTESEGPPIEVSRLIGEPGPQLLARAYQLDASAIVIGQRRDHNLGGRLLGRLASWMLRHGDRPVIVFHHD